MTAAQTTSIAALLTAWRDGTALADDLTARTDAALRLLLATPRKAIPAPVDPATLTDAQLFAYYKRIGLREDVRAFLAWTSADTYDGGQLRVRAAGLLAGLETRAATPADRVAYVAIVDGWRRLALAADYAARRVSHAA